MDHQSTSAGAALQVPIRVDTVGNEASYKFSVAFDPTTLTSPQVTIGDAGGDVVSTPGAPGQIGISVTTFSGGTIAAANNVALVDVTFVVASNASAGVTTVAFTDQPTKRKASGVDPNFPITQPTYTNGTITVREASSTVVSASASGRTVSLAADVLPTSASGTVEFFDSENFSVGSSPVASGHAALTLTNVSRGTHTYTALFTSTNSQVSGSASAAETVRVGAPVKVASTTTLTVASVALAGSRPVVKIKVRRGSAAATGQVKIVVAGTLVATLMLKAGKASHRLPKLTPGKKRVRAVYRGNATTAESTARKTITVRRR